MQVHFDMNYSSRGMYINNSCTFITPFIHNVDEFLQEHHLVLVTRLLPIVREIADARARNRDELEGIYWLYKFVYVIDAATLPRIIP